MTTTSKEGIGAIGYFYNQVERTRGVIGEYRQHFPEGSLVIINDNGSSHIEQIASMHKAIYHYYPENLSTQVKTPKDMIDWVQRILNAVVHIEEEWFILLEDDVTFLKKPSTRHLTGEANGFNVKALLPHGITQYLIEKGAVNMPLIGDRCNYSCCGGVILRTSFFRALASQDWKRELEEYAEITKVENPKIQQTWDYSDCILSFLILRYGGSIVQNPEWGEITQGTKGHYIGHPSFAILHRYKETYVYT